MITSICTIGTSHSVRDVGPVQSEATQKKMLLKSGTGGLTMVDLKPCPFCGGKGRMEVKDRTDWREYYQVGFVVCERCGCRTIGVDTAPGWKKIVTEAWNRRVDDERV